MAQMTRRQVLQTVMASAAGACLPSCATSAPPEDAQAAASRPNIIFVLADDLGYGDLGCYGQTQIQTPNIDAMAREGTRFTQCYAGSTVCAPSRCSLMTGLHTGHALIRRNRLLPLRPEDTTVAEVLKAAGYTTALVGKWGLGEPDTTGVPNRKGFDYFFGYLNQKHAHNNYPSYLWRNEEQVAFPENVQDPRHEGVALKCKTFSNDLFAQEANAFIERSKDKPFFLYLSFTMPHANNERGAATGDGLEVPSYDPYAKRPWPSQEKGYAAAVTRVDGYVGQLLATLKSLGLDQNTIVFFTSDNGTHKEGGANPAFFGSSGPLRGLKRDLYDGGIRVPMIARWPGHVPAGKSSDFVWAFWDFLPTAAGLAKTQSPAQLDGLSVVPALFGKRQAEHEYLYWEFHERGFQQAMRMGDWKAVLPKEGEFELYNLHRDINEHRNVADKNPRVVDRMKTLLATARTPECPLP